MAKDKALQHLRQHLLPWADRHPRPMPWKNERDPYKIWLSEIILQQTRVAQGLPYYERFIEAYPTVRLLADTSDEQLMKLWEGLGYYSRARNLHAAAKHIAYQLDGKFPATYAGIRALKGVGDYTAAAIASFAFDLPHAVLDGNVYRILARYMGIESPTDTPAAKKQFAELAQNLLDAQNPAAWNQAMMDFGATWCTPRQPRCGNCPMQAHCAAHAKGNVLDLPIKSKKMNKKTRIFLYFVFDMGGKTFLRKRLEKDIWQNLYEFPMAEVAHVPENSREAANMFRAAFDPKNLPAEGLAWGRLYEPARQLLTHQEIISVFQELPIEERHAKDLMKNCPPDWILVERKEIKNTFAVPKTMDSFLQKENPPLTPFS